MMRLAATRSVSRTFAQRASTAGPALQARNYHDNIVEHYENPRNVGSLDKKDSSVGTVCRVCVAVVPDLSLIWESLRRVHEFYRHQCFIHLQIVCKITCGSTFSLLQSELSSVLLVLPKDAADVSFIRENH